ncbi:MAG: hypothetical protein SF053_00060 [Bacteroidia bacterium]|nr:hypothetical protein [Bacteroidia bacterium]
MFISGVLICVLLPLQQRQSPVAQFSALPVPVFPAADTALDCPELPDTLTRGPHPCLEVVWDGWLYAGGWDTLPQTRFWRRIINLEKDSALVSTAGDRTQLAVIAAQRWDTLSGQEKELFKDSIRQAKGLPAHTVLYVTAGKKFYYKHFEALPTVIEAVQAFEDHGVDPWYAQTILLIESPGANNRSPVGAYGPFQLMPGVARQYGLKVGKSYDERASVSRSAVAAAGLISRVCIPQAHVLASRFDIPYDERDLWFRLLVLHLYHAGVGNVEGAVARTGNPVTGQDVIRRLWRTDYKGFKNASQNYSQVALAALLEFDALVAALPQEVCSMDPAVYVARELSRTAVQTGP